MKVHAQPEQGKVVVSLVPGATVPLYGHSYEVIGRVSEDFNGNPFDGWHLHHDDGAGAVHDALRIDDEVETLLMQGAFAAEAGR